MKKRHVIGTEEHRRVYAAERLSVELADRGEEMPEAGEEYRQAVDAWLEEHPEVVVCAEEGAEEAAYDAGEAGSRP